MSAERVHNWIDTPALAAMLATDEIDSWQVSEGRIVVGLYRPRDRMVTFRSLRDVEVPPCPDLAASIRLGLGEHATSELLAGQRPRCAEQAATSTGPMRPGVRCSAREIRVELCSQAEWDLEVTWHTWLAFRRRLNLTATPRDGGPPPPRPPRDFRVLTWAATRTTLQDAASKQLPLLGDAA